MIEKLKPKHISDVNEFLNRQEDKFEDFYLTIDKKRIFLKNNIRLIKKVLKYFECYGIYECNLEGIIFIYKSKGFRNYIKLLAKNNNIADKLLMYIMWKADKQDLFFKLKKDNEIVKLLDNTFTTIGFRGKELLLKKN